MARRQLLLKLAATPVSDLGPRRKRALHWHQSLVCLRASVELASWASAGELDAKVGHPWLVCGPAFASRVGKLTGVPVRTR